MSDDDDDDDDDDEVTMTRRKWGVILKKKKWLQNELFGEMFVGENAKYGLLSFRMQTQRHAC